jgi:hypothetical protein
MNPKTDTFRPVPTCEIPPPVLEGLTAELAAPGAIPRVLLQTAGSGRAARRVLLLAALFAAFSAMELALLLRLPQPAPLVVYGDFPRKLLMEGTR